MPANPVRGEISITLGDGVDYVLRPSYEAIVAIEAEAKRGLLDLARAADSGSLTTTEAAIVITECIRAQGRAVSDAILSGVNTRKVGELMLSGKGGFYIALMKLAPFLLGAATGGYTSTGEPRAAAGKGTPAVA